MKQKIASRSGKHSTLTILTKNRGLRTVYTSEKILFVGDYKLSLATVEGLRSLCFELLVRVNQGIVGLCMVYTLSAGGMCLVAHGTEGTRVPH